MRFALIGQPNSGKSTLFNQVAGYKAETGNFSGTTVKYTESKVRVSGEVIELVDLPGTYSLTGTNPAERESLKYLATHQVDVIINVIDATNLSQGLSLTIELLELQKPVVVALNMMDEALRMGILIDRDRLQDLIGVKILPLVASKGRGVRPLFNYALNEAVSQRIPKRHQYHKHIEESINKVRAKLSQLEFFLPPDSVALKLLETDGLLSFVKKQLPEIGVIVQEERKNIIANLKKEPIWLFSAERHGLSANYARIVTRQGERRTTLRDKLDDIALHPFWGYFVLVGILWIFFQVIYSVGSFLEAPLLEFFESLELLLAGLIDPSSLIADLLIGTLQGISGGIAIVIPYLLPFLLGLGFLEDIGYLPRLAFLMDALMHRLGLHGKAIVPFILGYGCSVPAIMSTRTLENKRDRFIAATLATMVPCAARLAVIFGLVAFYLGPQVALGIYLYNLLIISLAGRILSVLMPEVTPGLILEIPVFRTPTIKSLVRKVWFRSREFIVEAWPIMIGGSVILSLFNHFGITSIFDFIIRPITWILGLPYKVGVPLIFGILRKELSLIMLRQALKISDFSDAMTPEQMIVFTVFIVFYVPCLATLAVLRRELGMRSMLIITALTILIATGAALIARGFISLVI